MFNDKKYFDMKKKSLLKLVILLLIGFSPINIIYSQIASVEGFTSGWANQTFNLGTNDQVYMFHSGASVTSGTVNCFGSSASRYSVRPDNNGDYFEVQLNYSGTNKLIDQVSFNVTANGTTSGYIGHYGWSTDGTTWTNGAQFSLPVTGNECALYTVAAPSGNYKYFRIMRNGTSTSWAGTLGGGQTIRIYSMRVWTKSTCSPATKFTVSGTTSIPSGNSTDITLSDSEAGIDYQLYKGGVAEGSPKAGTDEALVWSVTPDATSTYTVKTVGTATYCETEMDGSAVITVTHNVPVIELTSATGTNTQSPTVNTAMSAITYSLAGGTATTASVTWTGTSSANTPPDGISVNFTYPILTISGIPTTLGNYGYTVTTDGSPAAEAIGSINVVKYAVGDYESVANGNWDVATTWKKWNGTGFTSPSPESPNSSTANVYIAAGTTVNYATGGKSMKNLIVEGVLTTNSLVNSPLYLNVYGDINVTSGGVIGDASNLNGDNSKGISISTYGNTTQTISGDGIISVSRLRLNSANTVIIDADMYINYHGSSNAGNASALYPMQTGSTLTINEGKTVTMDRWSSIYLNTSSTTLNGYNFNLNINGTLNFLPGSPENIDDKTLLKSYLVCNVSTSTNTFAINIGNNGILTVNDLYLNGNSQTGTSTGITTFVNNGILNIRLIGDFSRNAAQTITGTGTVNLLSGAEIKVANVNGLDNTIGNILTSTVNYNSGANYNFVGASAAQITGVNFPPVVNNLTINNSNNVTLSAPLTINGTLTLTAGELITGNNKLILNGATSGAGTINNTNETVEYSGTTEQVISNIKDNTLNNLLIDNPVGVSLATNLTVSDLTLNTDSKLNVQAGKKLTITGTATNNGTIKLLSNETNGTATLLGDVTGNAEVNQYLITDRNWYLSSPVSAAAVPTADAVWYYDETVIDNDPMASWKNPTGNLEVGKGYIVNPTGAAVTVQFNGTLNTGDKSIGLTRTQGASKEGFNLVGNPYPSYLNAATLLSTNSLKVEGNIWYRTHTGEAYQFQTYNSTSDVSVPKYSNGSYIPPMQGFWVRAKSNGVSLDFTNAMRKHNDSTVVILLRAPKAPVTDRQLIRLQVSSGSVSDELVIYSNSNASNAFDAYDSSKMLNGSTSEVPDMYTTAGSEKVVINGLNTLPLDVVIPVSFAANNASTTSFTISANEISNLPSGVTVKIVDNSVETSLSDGGTYTFTADAGTTKTFGLILRSPGAITGIENGNADKFHVYANSSRLIVVNAPAATLVNVYNATGQRIASQNMNSTSLQIDVPAAGVYMVSVGGKTFKIVTP
jgi:hypothetical protein